MVFFFHCWYLVPYWEPLWVRTFGFSWVGFSLSALVVFFSHSGWIFFPFRLWFILYFFFCVTKIWSAHVPDSSTNILQSNSSMFCLESLFEGNIHLPKLSYFRHYKMNFSLNLFFSYRSFIHCLQGQVVHYFVFNLNYRLFQMVE